MCLRPPGVAANAERVSRSSLAWKEFLSTLEMSCPRLNGVGEPPEISARALACGL